MGRRARRSGLALCAALVLCATGVTLQPVPVQQPANSSAQAMTSTRRDDGPVVVPDRYLIQTDGSVGAKAHAKLLSAITATGAEVNHVYSDTWDGVSVTASESQLAAILALPGVHESFPVYALELEDPPIGDEHDPEPTPGPSSGSPTDEPTETPTGEPTETPTGEPSETPTEEPTGDPTGEPTPSPTPDEPTETPTVEPGHAVTAEPDEATVDYLATTEIRVLANDTNAVPASMIFTDPGVQDEGKTLTVEGQGVFTVSDEGIVSFISLPGWAGTVEATYQVSGTDGSTATATITVTVTAPAAPSADDDAAAVVAGERVLVNVLDNDRYFGNATLQPSTLQLVSASTDKGVWAVEDGSISFSPADGYVGKATAEYEVADDLHRTTTAIVTVTVLAADRAASTDYYTPVTVELLPSSARPDSLSLVDPTKVEPENLVTELPVAGQGRFSVDGGSVIFSPDRGFAGTTDPVTYHFTDADGEPAEAEFVVTVRLPAGPTATADVARSSGGETVTVDVLDNDDPAPDVLWDKSSLCLSEDESCGSAVTDVGVGTWTVTPDGSEPWGIAFAPAMGFRGTATITYEVRDEFGQPVTAQLTVLVYSTPIAADHVRHGPAGHPVEQRVLDDGQPGEVVLTGEGTSSDGTSRTTEAGTWTVDGPTITFTPDDAFHGAATATDYRVVDAVGTAGEASITVTVGELPHATEDSATTKQNVALTGESAIKPLDNDTPGDDGAGGPGSFEPDSMVFVDQDGAELGTEFSTSAGDWAVDRSTGAVTFDPQPQFVGSGEDAATVRYRFRDSFGNAAVATISVDVTPVTPTADDDAWHGPARNPVIVDVLDGDQAGDDSAPLMPATVEFTDPAATDDGRSLETADGSWARNDDGTVTFEPHDDFHGNTTTTSYRLQDANGTYTEAATITVTIGVLSRAPTFPTATKQNITVELSLADMVSIGDDGAGTPGTLDCSTAAFTSDGVTEGGRVLVVQGVGRWELRQNGHDSCQITFDPESAFESESTRLKPTVSYSVTDSFGNPVEADVVVEVKPIVPDVVADPTHTAARTSVDIYVLANDSAGDSSAALQPSSLELLPGSGTGGTWRVETDEPRGPRIRFTPDPDFSETEASAFYQVRDANSTTRAAKITVKVGALPRAGDDVWQTDQGIDFTRSALNNDVAGDDGSGRPETRAFTATVLTGSGTTDGGKRLATANYTWTVDNTGKVNFTPYWRFTGTASTTYQATDKYGNRTTAKITVTVKPTAPTETEKRLTAIGALQSNADGAGIKVGIIDSGIDYTHPDLGGNSKSTFPTSRVTKGRNFVGSGAPMDCFGHGTHVAGIVGADGNPKQKGAYGVAPKVTFGAYRVFDCNGSGTTDNVLAAMQQAAADGMNVVNLSLGATSVSWPNETAYPLTQAAASLVKKGIVVVASAGNTTKGLFTVGSPAVAPGVISVAAANSTSTKVESYSAMGLAADLSLSPTLTTPGSTVWSTVPGSHANKNGTSMAAPQVAGAVAEILQARKWRTTPGTPAKVAALLYSTASTLKSSNSKLSSYSEAVFRQGAGLLRLDAALNAQVTASPSVLKLGEGTSETQTITLTNIGPKAITYKVSAATGTSAAASTGSKTDVGNQTPYWAYGGVGFKASPSSVTVKPGTTAKVKVTITAPSRILVNRQGMLYGGWVRFTASGQQTVSVPFAGLRGDYQKVKLLPSGNRRFTSGNVSIPVKLPALAYQTNGTIEPTYSGTRTFRIGRTGGQPHIMFHLDYPTSAIRLKATNTRTKKSYYAVLSGTSTQLGKRGRDEGHSSIAFYGVYKNSKGKLARVPKGTYKLQLRVLKPLGSSGKSSHWETYTTRSFKLTWS